MNEQPLLFYPPGSYWVTMKNHNFYTTGARFLVIGDAGGGRVEAWKNGTPMSDSAYLLHEDHFEREDGKPKAGDSLPMYTAFAEHPTEGKHHLSLDEKVTLCGEPVAQHRLGETKWPFECFISHPPYPEQCYHHDLCKRCQEILKSEGLK